MTHWARTVTPRLLLAISRRHEVSLRVFGDPQDWPAIAGDGEWLYNQTAMDACAAASARLFSEALEPDQRGVRRFPEIHAAVAGRVTPEAVGVLANPHEATCGGRSAGERGLARRGGTVRRILALVLRGGGLRGSSQPVGPRGR